MKVAFDDINDILVVTYRSTGRTPLCFERGPLLLRVDPVEKVLLGVTIFDVSRHKQLDIPSPDEPVPPDMAQDCEDLADCLVSLPDYI